MSVMGKMRNFATYSIYLETASRFLTPLEVSLLPYAAELFPYMQ